jgi:hypothetical protein
VLVVLRIEVRRLARRRLGIGEDAVAQIWSDHNLKRVRSPGYRMTRHTALRLKGHEGAKIWAGYGVLAHNVDRHVALR